MLLFLSAPNFIAFWVLIYFGDKYYHILIARFFGGIVCGGVQSAIVLFVSEIANDEWVVFSSEIEIEPRENFDSNATAENMNLFVLHLSCKWKVVENYYTLKALQTPVDKFAGFLKENIFSVSVAV